MISTSVKVITKEHKATSIKATAQKVSTCSNNTTKEHDASTVEEATTDELEEATPDIDGDNLKLSIFIPVGFKKRKAHSRPTHNDCDPVHLPKTRSGSK